MNEQVRVQEQLPKQSYIHESPESMHILYLNPADELSAIVALGSNPLELRQSQGKTMTSLTPYMAEPMLRPGPDAQMFAGSSKHLLT